ncbi:MAG: LytTR family DNA-binding domain-containing protein, partial [Christiangramia sp.]|nr:LytTR family DNA-binding domain-containing protein [Christiangramia sp.]
MRTIIVDDEKLARDRVLRLLSELEEVEVVKECSSGKKAISAVNELKPDLLLLDIDMKDMNGFQVLEKITASPKPVVIFITAHDQYALKAFEFEAFDFLLKPFKEERFFKTINKVLQTASQPSEKDFEKKIEYLLRFFNAEQNLTNFLEKIPIKQGNKTYLIDVPDIKYILASGYYVEIYTEEKMHLLRDSLNSLADNLDTKIFVRIHRSVIINISYIQEIIHSDFGEIDVRMKDRK